MAGQERGDPESQLSLCGEGSSQEVVAQTQRVRGFGPSVTFNIVERAFVPLTGGEAKAQRLKSKFRVQAGRQVKTRALQRREASEPPRPQHVWETQLCSPITVSVSLEMGDCG